MAVREGFEPSIRDKPYTPLAGERLQPLGHLTENNGALGRIRTSDRLVRSQVLYPAELRAHINSGTFFNKKMVRPGGFEPPTAWFVARYSIQLSYGRTGNTFSRNGGEGGIRTLDTG